MSEWLPVNEKLIKELPIPSTLRIDTRDFCGAIHVARAWWLQYKTARCWQENKIYSSAEIIATIEEIKKLSGGEIKWRMMDLPGVSDNSGWNLKYLNIYRASDSQYLLLTSEGSIVSKSLLSKINYVCPRLKNGPVCKPSGLQ